MTCSSNPYYGQHKMIDAGPLVDNVTYKKCAYCGVKAAVVHPAPEPEAIPDSTEPVVALRHWRMIGEHFFSSKHPTVQLTAPMHHDVAGKYGSWHPGECQAWCTSSQTSSDKCAFTSGACGCGFYGVWRADHSYAVKTQYDVSVKYTASMGTVFGAFEAYGKVRLGEKGLRASKARIVALHLPLVERTSPQWELNRYLFDQYEPEGVKFYRSRGNLLRAHHSQRPDALLSVNFG